MACRKRHGTLSGAGCTQLPTVKLEPCWIGVGEQCSRSRGCTLLSSNRLETPARLQRGQQPRRSGTRPGRGSALLGAAWLPKHPSGLPLTCGAAPATFTKATEWT